jgi:hypothetical protein
MAENVQRSRGRTQNYKFDRGGMPAEMGPYIGIVVNNVDLTRSGRLQVYIEQFGSTDKNGKPDLTNTALWRTVSYCPPFYGATPQSGTSAGAGTYPGNRNSYGMWFTPPDIGVSVLCFFVAGDPNQGYYVGCIPEQGINHMIPAIGSSQRYVAGNASQENYFVNTPLLPVTEINELNKGINDNPRFFTAPKPVQSVVAGILFQQGLNRDPIRGPIRSNSQRESPSTVYGISTPGKPIYQGGLDPKTITSKLEKGEIKPQDVVVIGRQGGHTLVMDDGDLAGTDTLVRIRTAKGHQITMSDDGDCFYITHANGQTWIELGKQGTVDVFSTNSVNIRTQGTINLHADQNINMYAGGSIRMKANNQLRLEGNSALTMYSDAAITMFGKTRVGIRSDGVLALKGKTSSWDGGSSLNLKGQVINLNGAAAQSVSPVQSMAGYKLVDTKFVANQGWTPQPGTLNTIVTRAPTHEPYPYHGKGVNVTSNLNSTNAGTSNTQTAATANTVSLRSLTEQAYERTNTTAIQNPISAENYLAEPPAIQSIPINQD